MVRGADRRSVDAVPAERFHLFKGGRVLVAVHRGRRGRAELGGGLHHERSDLAPISAQGDRTLADRVLAPFTGTIEGEKLEPEFRFDLQ